MPVLKYLNPKTGKYEPVASVPGVPFAGWLSDEARNFVPEVNGTQDIGQDLIRPALVYASNLDILQGIKFPATQNPSSDPYTQDDFEEGDWTPAWAATIGGAPAMGHQFGRYQKVGKRVNLWGSMYGTINTMNGSIRVVGLPYQTLNIGGAWQAGTVGYSNNFLNTANTVPHIYVDPGATQIIWTFMHATGTTAEVSCVHTNINSVTCHLMVAISYDTND